MEIIMKKSIYKEYLTLTVCIAAVIFLVGAFTGQWPWISSPYNSYVLQAESWMKGRLDLGRDYSWLEIARYKDKYYISFPPFPSYIMLPFTAVFGASFSGGIIAAVSFILAGVYCFKLIRRYSPDSEYAVFYALLATVCSNYLFIAINDWVWFIAQNLCFTLSVAAIYYASCGKGAYSFMLWACAVGCRPFSVLYFPLLVLLCYENTKLKKGNFALRLIIWGIVPFIIGLSYMILNVLRFGNPFEFGHNYLPEFSEAPKGQFSVSYFFTNLYSLIRLPALGKKGFDFPEFNGMNMLVASPVFIVGIISFIRCIIKGDKAAIAAVLGLCAELFFILCHKTMGGSHYGNRYTVDVIPFAFYAVAAARVKKPNTLYIALAVIGFGLNFGWIIRYFS